MAIIESATRLFELPVSRDDTFTKYLTFGLPEEEIARLVEPSKVALPPEVLAFYRCFNLPDGYWGEPEQPAFYGIYWMLGLKEAVEGYLTRQTYDFLSEEERRCFPFLAEDGNGYLIDTAASKEGDHLSIYEQKSRCIFGE